MPFCLSWGSLIFLFYHQESLVDTKRNGQMLQWWMHQNFLNKLPHFLSNRQRGMLPLWVTTSLLFDSGCVFFRYLMINLRQWSSKMTHPYASTLGGTLLTLFAWIELVLFRLIELFSFDILMFKPFFIARHEFFQKWFVWFFISEAFHWKYFGQWNFSVLIYTQIKILNVIFQYCIHGKSYLNCQTKMC